MNNQTRLVSAYAGKGVATAAAMKMAAMERIAEKRMSDDDKALCEINCLEYRVETRSPFIRLRSGS